MNPIRDHRRVAGIRSLAGLLACTAALLASRAHADTIVQEGGLSGPGGPVNEHVIELDRFDPLGGTRALNFVKLEFSTMLFAESVTNGAGGMVHATAALWADYAFADGTPIADTSTSLDVMVDNTGKPVATLYLDADEAVVDYTQPAELAPWIGSGTITLGALAQLTRTEDPAGVIEWSAGGLVTYRVTYDFAAVPPCPADLATLLDAWGAAGGDVTGDGVTDASDLAALLVAWGAC